MNLKHGSFSVVTPNYNMAYFLPETIESVLSNLRQGDEYFVIDGGSTDGSIEIIRRYESELTGWVSEADNCYADALGKGFQRCTGEFLCWINSGDLLLKGALQAGRQALMKMKADLIFGDDVYIDEEGKVILYSRGYVRSLRHMMLYGGWTPLQDACFWRHSLYNSIGGMNPRLKYAADYDFFLRASWAGKCLYVGKVFSAFRRHQGQKSFVDSPLYEAERESCRKQVLGQLGGCTLRRLIFQSYYWFLVRWRYHIARRFQHSVIPARIPVSSLVVA